MNTNVNLEAAIGVLAFMVAAFVLGLAAIFILHALKTRKLMREGAFVTRFIIGHENSFWHGKTKFDLES